MQLPLAGWVQSWLRSSVDSGNGPNPLQVFSEFDMRSQNEFPIAHQAAEYGIESVIETLLLQTDLCLDFVDFLIFKTAQRVVMTRYASMLEEILEQSGSMWRVGIRNGSAGLERRVSGELEQMADLELGVGDTISKYIGEAWADTFGRNPRPSIAYVNCVKALEACLVNRVIPNDASGIVSRALSQMKTDDCWSFNLKQRPSYPSSEALILTLRSIVSGQDRHAGNGDLKVSVAEAETAVVLTVAILHLFRHDLILPRTNEADLSTTTMSEIQ
jgi:hypothetical protein